MYFHSYIKYLYHQFFHFIFCGELSHWWSYHIFLFLFYKDICNKLFYSHNLRKKYDYNSNFVNSVQYISNWALQTFLFLPKTHAILQRIVHRVLQDKWKIPSLSLKQYTNYEIGYLKESLISFIKYRSILLKIFKNIKKKAWNTEDQKKKKTQVRHNRHFQDVNFSIICFIY